MELLVVSQCLCLLTHQSIVPGAKMRLLGRTADPCCSLWLNLRVSGTGSPKCCSDGHCGRWFSEVPAQKLRHLSAAGVAGQAALPLCPHAVVMFLYGACGVAAERRFCCNAFVLCFRCSWKSHALISWEPSRPSGEFTMEGSSSTPAFAVPCTVIPPLL